MNRAWTRSFETPEEAAERFHGRADKTEIFRRFEEKAHGCTKQQAQRYAFHVAAWLACAPSSYIAGIMEMNLLETFLLKLDGGRLDGRLQTVLPRALAALELANLPATAFEEARERLIKSLHRFPCCKGRQDLAIVSAEAPEDQKQAQADAKEEEKEDGDEESDEGQHVNIAHESLDVVQTNSFKEREEGRQVCNEVCHDEPFDEEAEQARAHVDGHAAGEEEVVSKRNIPCFCWPAFFSLNPIRPWVLLENPMEAEQDCKSSPEHFFRKMNEWTNMEVSQKRGLERRVMTGIIQGWCGVFRYSMEDGEKLSLLKQLRDASKAGASNVRDADLQALCIA